MPGVQGYPRAAWFLSISIRNLLGNCFHHFSKESPAGINIFSRGLFGVFVFGLHLGMLRAYFWFALRDHSLRYSGNQYGMLEVELGSIPFKSSCPMLLYHLSSLLDFCFSIIEVCCLVTLCKF